MLTRAGRPVIIDATAHRRAWRELARACTDNLAEVQLVCPLEAARECERTRPAGHHPRAIDARRRHGADVPGVADAYEDATAPDLASIVVDPDCDVANGRPHAEREDRRAAGRLRTHARLTGTRA